MDGIPYRVDFNQIYDIETDSWSLGNPVPVSNGANAVATSGLLAPKRIYVIGGGLNQVYDPANDSWVNATPMPSANRLENFDDVNLAVLNDQIYAMGGVFAENESRYSTNYQYTPLGYIPEFPSWTPLLIMLVAVVVTFVYRQKVNKQRRFDGVCARANPVKYRRARAQKTWYKWSGQYGKIYGTSFSAAWASGQVALLTSAFPDFHSLDINGAIHFSVIKNHQENPKLKMDFPNTKYAYDWLMARRASEKAVGKDGYIIPESYKIVISNTNSFVFAQKVGVYMQDFNGLPYTPSSLARDLEKALNYLWSLIRRQQYKFAITELVNIKQSISANDFPSQHQTILDLMSICNKALS
jgi:hypothetical protein